MTMDNSLGDTPPALREGFKLEDYIGQTDDSPDVTPPADTTPKDDNEDKQPEVITLSKENLYKEIERVAGEDAHFAEVVGAYGGRKASSKYESKLAEQEIELAQLRRDKEKREILSMDTTELDRKFAEDKDFAQRYTDLIHSKDEDILAVQENLHIASALRDVFESAYDDGLTPEQEKKFREEIAAGKYDSGKGWTSDILQFQQAIYRELKSTPTETKQEEPKIEDKKVEKPVDNANPDVTGTGIIANQQGTKWTREQIRNMNPDEYVQHFPNPGDEAKAVRAGMIIDSAAPA